MRERENLWCLSEIFLPLHDRQIELMSFVSFALSIRLTEDGILTRCELTTYDPDAQMMGLQFDDDSKVQKLIMKVSILPLPHAMPFH